MTTKAPAPQALIVRSAPESPGPVEDLTIPRVFHQIWLGDRPLPEAHKRFCASWAEHHPDWQVIVWTDDTIPPLRNQASYDTATTHAQRSDIARYEILLEHGGVYIDTDFECLRNIEPLLREVDAFAASEDGTWVSIGIMGAVPNHPWIEALVDAVPEGIASHPGEPPNRQTGPWLATRLQQERVDAALSVPVVYAPSVFYPYLYDEPHRRFERFGDAYAVHHWEASWLAKAQARVSPGRLADGRLRIGVEVDWTHPDVAATVLAAASCLCEADPTVEIALVIPDLCAQDRSRVLRLVEEATGDRRAPDITAYDPAELAALDLSHFVGAGRDTVETAHALAETVSLLTAHGPMRRSPSSRPPPEPAPVAAARVAPAIAGAPNCHGTYIGDGRMFVTTTWGGRMYASARDMSITPELLAHGFYDGPFTNFLQRTVSPGQVCIDVGANIGLFTLLMGSRVGASGRVIAYECQPDNHALLADNIALNYLSGWVECRPTAAGRDAGTLSFHVTERFAGNGSLVAHDQRYLDAYRVDSLRQIDVDVEPLDVHLGLGRAIDLIKIDVEGGEEQVFAGMERLLAAGMVRRVCFECLASRMSDDWEPFTQRLWRLAADGWCFYLIDEAGDLRPVDVARVTAVGDFTQVLMQRP